MELINALREKIVHCFADKDECWAIIVKLDDEALDVLEKMGSTRADIMHRVRWSKETGIVVCLTEFDWWRPEMGIGLIGKEAVRLPREDLEAVP